MFANYKVQPSIVSQLDEMSELFTLTGSVFFEGHGKDLDFFVQYDEQVKIKLYALGFRPISKDVYGDSQCVEVLRNGMIDIQLVKDAVLKNKVQEKFKTLGYTKPTTEEWNLAFLWAA